MSSSKPNVDLLAANRDIDGLIDALKNDDCIIRKEAVVALKTIGDKKALLPLIDALKYEEWHEKYVVLSSVREYAAEALGLLKDKNAVNPLIEALNDNDEDVRFKAAWALGNIGDKRAVESLIGALNDERWSVRRFAAISLGKIRDERSLESLVRSLKEDNDWHVRRYAADALGNIGDERIIPSLVSSLSDEDEDVRRMAIIALGKMKKAAVKPLIEAFGSEDWRIRARVAEALGSIGDKRAVDILINALIGKTKDNNRFVRGRVAEALGKIGDERAIEPLIHARDDSYKYARIKAEEALEMMNTTLFLSYDDEEITFDYPISWEITSMHDREKNSERKLCK